MTISSIAKKAGLGLLGLLMLAVAGWGVLALVFWDHANPVLRNALAVAYGVTALVLIMLTFMSRRWRWRALGTFAVLFALLLASWNALLPSNDRDWQPENAVPAYASIDGNRITLHNIRNFDYRSETDSTPRYYDRTFDLQQLDSVDLFTVYWMGPAIAHVFVSFGFTDGNHVAISIEARRERTDTYSSLKGFFRQYELYYAVGDERDIVRLRTNYRHNPVEDVYLYRVQSDAADRQRLFLEYLRRLNALRDQAQWYNTLTTNCTNTIWMISRVNPQHARYSWKILLSGHVPELLYEEQRLDTRLPFEDLRQRAHINELAHAADQAVDFSQRIRASVGQP
jgi:hypothetical protein